MLTRRSRPFTSLMVLVLVAGACVGCSATAGPEDPGLGDESRAPLEVPAAPVLTDPPSAVGSYTDWVSYAYLVMDARVAEDAISAYEEVRVSAYIERNRSEQGRGIHQVLIQSDYELASQEETSAVVTGVETWIYRYFDAETRDYTSDVLEASYDVTYTVIVEEPKGWVVDRVEATPRGEVE